MTSPLLLAFSLLVLPDERIDWLLEHGLEIEAIDAGADDFADLEPLVEMIGGSRVVALGEQTHGDGATFQAKVRLVKFLHQRMGFDVLAWESGMVGCHLVEEAYREGVEPLDAAGRGIFPIWTRSAQLEPLFEYVAETHQSPRPLEIAGFDCQVTGRNTPEALTELVENMVGHLDDPALAPALETVRSVLQGFASQQFPTEEADHRGFQNARQTLQAALAASNDGTAAASPREIAFVHRALTNFGAAVEMMYVNARRGGQASRNQLDAALIRERTMADCLIFLAREHFPRRKIIVWAATSHMTYNSRSVESRGSGGDWELDKGEWEPMGNRVREVLEEQLYTIGFLAFGGHHGTVTGSPVPLPAPPSGSLDDLCYLTGIPYLFLDLRSTPDEEGGAWLREPQVARPRGYQPMRTDWSNVCDALFFIDEMIPSTAIAGR